MFRILCFVGVGSVAVVAAAALALAPTAGATHLESGMSISVADSAKLVNGVYLVVPVSVTCPAIELSPTQFIQFEDAFVSVSEKVGKVVTGGGGQVSYYSNGPSSGQAQGTPLTCDGAPHAYAINVFPESSGYFPIAPFKGGKAVAFGYFSISIFDTSTFEGDSNNVQAGPISISIKG